MSIRVIRYSSRALPLVAAALFLHVGSAAAASPQGDIQQQMRDVLTGSAATHAPSVGLDPANAVRVSGDAQDLVRQVLAGWSVSHARRAQASQHKQQIATSKSSHESQTEEEDFQSAVQRSLLGDRAVLRGAL